MTSKDVKLQNVEKRRAKRKADEDKRIEIEKKRPKISDLFVSSLTNITDLDDEVLNCVFDCLEDKDPDYFKDSKDKKIEILTSDLLTSLDRGGVSNRDAFRIIADVCKSLNHNIKDLNLCPTTLIRMRKKNRKTVSNKIKKNFDFNRCLTLHWDGKKLFDSNIKKFIEHLVVKVSWTDGEKIIDVLRLKDGKADSSAKSIIELLIDWKIADKIFAFSFDTTATNTGKKGGICKILLDFYKDKFEREILLLPCRHHVMEVVLSHVSKFLFGETVGPKNQMYVKFQNVFSSLDKSKLSSNVSLVNKSISTSEKKSILQFINDQLIRNQKRRDYTELLELCSNLLNNEIKYKIKPTGAISHARWMSNIIYCIKMLLLKDQLKDNLFDFKSIERFVIFSIKCYIRFWFTCESITQAPTNDLLMVKSILNFKDKEISTIAFKAFKNHFYYFDSKLACFCLFDQNLELSLKEQMRKLITKNRKKTSSEVTSKTKITDFFSTDSLKFFKIIKASPSFLYVPSKDWQTNDNYKEILRLINNLNPVNDSAERGVKLATKYNNLLTKNNENSEIIQIVEEDCINRSIADKNTYQ